MSKYLTIQILNVPRDLIEFALAMAGKFLESTQSQKGT